MPNPVKDRAPPSRGLAILILMAVGFGVLAALLSSGVNSNFTPTAPSPAVPWANPITILGDIAFAIFAGYIAFEVYKRFRDGRMPVPARLAITGIFAILIGILFIVAAHFLHLALVAPSHPGGNSSSIPPGQGQGTGPPPLNASNNSSGGFFGGVPISSFPQFTWSDLGLLGLAVATVVALVVILRVRSEHEGPSSPDPALAARLRRELLDSLQRLEDDPNTDPRAVIQSLYHRLLLLIVPRFHSTDPYTPREIAAVLVAQFGAGPAHAQELTDLFEEARYSTHPLGRREADRARNDFRALAEDLRPAGLAEPGPAPPARAPGGAAPPPTPPAPPPA